MSSTAHSHANHGGASKNLAQHVGTLPDGPAMTEADVKIFGNKAIAMGHYYFTAKATGQESKVEYTKGYVKSGDGRVLIFLQDSSLPYSAN